MELVQLKAVYDYANHQIIKSHRHGGETEEDDRSNYYYYLRLKISKMLNRCLFIIYNI